MRIVVVGGTGLVGGRVSTLLRAGQHEVVVASPTTGVDVLTGAGVQDALEGADVVVDLVNSPSFADDAVMDFFLRAGRTVHDAEVRAGVRHHVALSVVGADRLPDSGYLRAKLAQEQLVRRSGVPFTIVRSTQFFEFLRGIADSAADGDVVRVPAARLQPVAAADVSAFVASAALDQPADQVVEVAGPEALPLADLVGAVLSADGDEREVVADAQARYFGALITDESLVPHGEALLGRTTFLDWLPAGAGHALARG